MRWPRYRQSRKEIYDAAVLDCESHWQAMRHIGIPLAWPVMSVAILLRLIEGFKAFGLPFAMTSGGPGTSTAAVQHLQTI